MRALLSLEKLFHNSGDIPQTRKLRTFRKLGLRRLQCASDGHRRPSLKSRTDAFRLSALTMQHQQWDYEATDAPFCIPPFGGFCRQEMIRDTVAPTLATIAQGPCPPCDPPAPPPKSYSATRDPWLRPQPGWGRGQVGSIEASLLFLCHTLKEPSWPSLDQETPPKCGGPLLQSQG